jgi:hypothetical protein
MDRCPKCGHWMLSYNLQNKWECYCHTVIYHDSYKGEHCHCDHIILESRDSSNNRLREENHHGRYSVDPPVDS